jgi:hypothetical protein
MSFAEQFIMLKGGMNMHMWQNLYGLLVAHFNISDFSHLTKVQK